MLYHLDNVHNSDGICVHVKTISIILGDKAYSSSNLTGLAGKFVKLCALIKIQSIYLVDPINISSRYRRKIDFAEVCFGVLVQQPLKNTPQILKVLSLNIPFITPFFLTPLFQYSFENFDLILLFPGLFDFERAAETEILIQTLLWSLCVMHVIITNVISRRKVKPSDVCHDGNSKHDVGNRFNEEVMDALEQMIKNSVGK